MPGHLRLWILLWIYHRMVRQCWCLEKWGEKYIISDLDLKFSHDSRVIIRQLMVRLFQNFYKIMKRFPVLLSRLLHK